MGLMDRIFGTSSKSLDTKKQRAEFKNIRHFEATLKQKEATKQLILTSNEKLVQDKTIEPFNHWSVAMMILDMIYINYSIGNSISECNLLYKEAAKWYKYGWDSSAAYSDMLDMVSLGYLLKAPDSYFDGIVEYVKNTDKGSDDEQWHPDAILWYIIAAKNGNGNTTERVRWPKLYQLLLDITKMSKKDAELAMQSYLDNWYALHRNDPWYDNHKKELVYKGYWSWEAAAITKIMKLDDTSFKDHPNYPYDMVHWNFNE